MYNKMLLLLRHCETITAAAAKPQSTDGTLMRESKSSKSHRRRIPVIPPSQLLSTQRLVERLVCMTYKNIQEHRLDTNELFSTLTDLEDLAHHIDIGELLTLSLPQSLECTEIQVNIIVSIKSTLHLLADYYTDWTVVRNETINTLSTHVIAAALQNNPVVQQWALDSTNVPPLTETNRPTHSLLSKFIWYLCDGQHHSNNNAAAAASYLYV